MTIRHYLTTDAEKYLEEGNLLVAMLRISADLETLLFEKLFFEKGIELELIENWNLFRYVEWNIKLGLINKNKKKLLDKFRKERNRLVHERIYLEKIKKDKEKLNDLIELINNVIQFVKNTKIEYKHDWHIEKKYGEYYDKQNTKNIKK